MRELLSSGKTMKLYKRSSLPCNFDPEWQADNFSKAMILPLRELQKSMREGCNIPRLVERLKAPKSEILARLRLLK